MFTFNFEFIFFVIILILFIQQVAEDVKVGRSELMNFQKHRDEILKEMDKVKFEQEEIEKTCLKLCNLSDNVIIFSRSVLYKFIIYISIKII